ncbi:MAG: endolytic transglycosylase MltG [Patescibacteria group bacterium]
MLLVEKINKKIVYLFVFMPIILVAIFFSLEASPVSNKANYEEFYVSKGESLDSVAERLGASKLIRSPLVFKILGLATGSSKKIQPGQFDLSPHLSTAAIISKFVKAGSGSITVTIPEGLTIYEVDKILSEASVISPGALIRLSKDKKIEGRLFPDTYKFLTNTKTEEIVDIFIDNFDKKVGSILGNDPKNQEENLILASLIQEEIPDPGEQKIAAGVLKKRVKVGMPLQVDATICYAKRVRSAEKWASCYPLTPLDMKIDSTYNTYLYKGWPPGPIASPGFSAVSAAVEPQDSPYWFYLSDPLSRRTVFSENLEEHNRNISTFLKS